VATGPVRFGSNNPNMLASTYVSICMYKRICTYIYICYALISFGRKNGISFSLFTLFLLCGGGGRGDVDKSTKGKEFFLFFSL
jgi:hypothetical protein